MFNKDFEYKYKILFEDIKYLKINILASTFSTKVELDLIMLSKTYNWFSIKMKIFTCEQDACFLESPTFQNIFNRILIMNTEIFNNDLYTKCNFGDLKYLRCLLLLTTNISISTFIIVIELELIMLSKPSDWFPIKIKKYLRERELNLT